MTFIKLLIFGILLVHNPKNLNAQYSVLDTKGCVFPFTYHGKSYSTCIKNDKKYPWCSFTKDYQGVWKYCNDMTQTDWKCANDCSLQAGDPYPTCQTSSKNQKMYCIDQIINPQNKHSDLMSKNCAPEYQQIQFHTACQNPNPNLAKTGVSNDDKTDLVNLHNQWRGAVDVPAANMLKMYWDDELAMLATKHAQRCSFAHDDGELRSIPGTGKITGQNIVMATGTRPYNWTTAYNEMFDGEKIRWQYGTGLKQEYIDYGQNALHYTQLIKSSLTKLGCGYAECVYPDRVERLFVCNYDEMQFDYEVSNPYKKGSKPCQDCPNNCVNNLCDCGNKECFNGGKLNVGSCQCECSGLWSGDHCQTKIESKTNAQGCAIPFVYKNKLNYACISDPDVGDVNFCLTVPTYDNNPDNVLVCDDKKKREIKFPMNYINYDSFEDSSEDTRKGVIGLKNFNLPSNLNSFEDSYEDYEKKKKRAFNYPKNHFVQNFNSFEDSYEDKKRSLLKRHHGKIHKII